MNTASYDPLPYYVAKRVGRTPQSLLNLAKNLVHLETTDAIPDWSLNDHKATIAGILALESYSTAKTTHSISKYAALNPTQVCDLALHVEHLIAEGNLQRNWLSGPAQGLVTDIQSISNFAKEARRLPENPGSHLPVMSQVPEQLLGSLTP